MIQLGQICPGYSIWKQQQKCFNFMFCWGAETYNNLEIIYKPNG